MREEIQMSDDNKKPDGSDTNPKTYSESEFKEVVAQRQINKQKVDELEQKLKAIEDTQKKAEEEKAKADGKLGELLKAREDEVVKLKLDFETAKADADAYHKYQTSVIEEAKKVMGEKWDDNFAKLPLDTVVKLAGVSMKSPGMGGTPPPSQNINNLYTMDEIKGMTQEEVNTNLEKVNKSLAAMKK
jgi:hypothetical protein